MSYYTEQLIQQFMWPVNSNVLKHEWQNWNKLGILMEQKFYYFRPRYYQDKFVPMEINIDDA
jgi:hypothetical protein